VVLITYFSDRGVLKIGDFGLSRVFSREGDQLYSHQVATRWYRYALLLWHIAFIYCFD
jgi:serine/threonine protein kinase